MNGLSINVITDTQKDLLSSIDKINDPELRGKLLNFCLEQRQSHSQPIPEIMQLPSRHYNLQEVFRRIETEQPVTLQDLKKEINILKIEVKQLKNSVSLQNDKITYLQVCQSIKNKEIVPSSEETTPSSAKGKEVKEDDDSYLNLLQRITYQKLYIKITIVIHQEYTIQDAIALVDSGADLNCIQE